MITTKDMVEFLDNLAKDALYQPFDYTPNDGARFAAIRDFITAHSWQDISTAKLGVEVILYYPPKIDVTHESNNRSEMIRLGFKGDTPNRKPTKWMPLPAAPQPKED